MSYIIQKKKKKEKRQEKTFGITGLKLQKNRLHAKEEEILILLVCNNLAFVELS